MNIPEIIKAPMVQDWIYTIGAFFIISLLILFSTLLKKYFSFQEEIPRKVVHMTVGVMAAIAPSFYYSPLLLLLVAFFFGLLDWIAVRRGLLKGIHGHRYSYGTVYFPLAYIILIVFCWPANKNLISIGIFLFAIPDAIAALVGENIKSAHRFKLIKDDKSVEGTLAMFAASFISLIFLFYFLEITPDQQKSFYLMLFAISIIVTAVELLSSHGSDNLFIPLSAALSTQLFLQATPAQFDQIILAMALALAAAVLSYFARFLTLSGSVMVFLLATAIFGLGGLKWTVPILTFFILSSILSQAGKGIKNKFKDTFEKTGVRDYAQVLANGGIGGILILFHAFYNSEVLYFLYLLSLAVATADTWATEIGIFFKFKPRLITNFKRVEPGISGAISIHGSLGALSGSFILILSAVFFINPLNWQFILLLVFLGFLGSMIDSLLGATLQSQYCCIVCEKYTEKKIHCQKPSKKIRGYTLVSNDFVNLSSSLSILLIYSLIQLFI